MNAPVDVSFFARAAKPLTSYRKYWAPASARPLPADEPARRWTRSAGTAATSSRHGRRLRRPPQLRHGGDRPRAGGAGLPRGHHRAAGLAERRAFKALGKPNLFWGVTAGNMDSMINRYTADRKLRSDDAYTPGDVGGKRPDRAAIVYSQRCREAFKDVPIILGGIEGSLRRIAHYDYWSEKVRHSVVLDAKCDLLLYGNAERAIIEIAHRLAAASRWRTSPTCAAPPSCAAPRPKAGSRSTPPASTARPRRGPRQSLPDHADQAKAQGETCAKEDDAELVASPPGKGRGEGKRHQPLQFVANPARFASSSSRRRATTRSFACLPTSRSSDPVLYAHANRVLHLETNPATPARWCRRTASATCGSTRRPSR
jgi:uncharacterized radical SAM protein YgiQ